MNKLICILLAFVSPVTFGCSFAQMLEEFVITNEVGSAPEKPDFEVESILRGSDDGDFSTCSDAGIITLKRNKAPADKVGYYFELVEGQIEDQLFYPEPVIATEFYESQNWYKFLWLDGSNNEQEPINIRVKITAVSKTGQKSDPQYLQINHPGVKKPWWQLW